MARISYKQALKCKKCGHFTLEVDRSIRHVLCQGCGAHIMDYDGNGHGEYIGENAEPVSVKVTHKLFSTTYEEVT